MRRAGAAPRAPPRRIQLVCLGALALTFALRGGVNDVFSWQLDLVLQFPASLVLVGIFLGALSFSPPSRFDAFWIALAWVLPPLHSVGPLDLLVPQTVAAVGGGSRLTCRRQGCAFLDETTSFLT